MIPLGAYTGSSQQAMTANNRLAQGEAPVDSPLECPVRDAEILKRRAEEYARVLDPYDNDNKSETDVLLFKLGGDSYAIPCADIEEIVPLQNLVSIPHTPRGIIGISSNRGVLFAVLDPKLQLQIPGTNITTMHRVVILRHKAYRIGILVDAVVGMAGIDTQALLQLPAYINAEKKGYISGLTPDRTFLLNVHGLIEDPALSASI